MKDRHIAYVGMGVFVMCIWLHFGVEAGLYTLGFSGLGVLIVERWVEIC